MAKLIVGIDIGKYNHQATVIDQSGQILGGSIKFNNSILGAELLLQRITSINPQKLPLVFGLEATGHYWLPLYSFLAGKRFPVHVINPYQSDAWRKIYLSTTKTDKEDSFLIADIIRFGSFSQTKLAEEHMVSLRNLTRFRVSLNQQLTDTKRRIITILDQIFPEFESLFSSIFGKTAKALLSEFPTPQDINDLSLEKLTTLVNRVSRGRFNKTHALKIKESAENSFGIKFALDSFTLQLRLLMAQLEFLENQLKTVDAEIARSMKASNSVLLSLPGINTTLSAAILAEIGDIKRFKNSAQLTSFAGLDPTVRQSGNFTGNKNHISKKGSPYLRFALWQAAVASVRANPILRNYYQKKIKEGKHHMIVLGAIARKLTGLIYSLLKNNSKFNLGKLKLD